MIVSALALFVSLGGASYAATQLPSGSVGSAQLKNQAVTSSKLHDGSVGNWKLGWGAVGPRKLMNGAVGIGQINASQVQARVTGSCFTGAIAGVDSNGKVTCVSAPPSELGTSSTAVTLGTGNTQVASLSLPRGSSYLTFANPYVTVGTASTSATSPFVEVDCTLSGNGATITRTVRLHSDSSAAGTAAIPLIAAVPASGIATPATVSCRYRPSPGSRAPAVTAVSTINAIQTATNTTEPNGTS
jgi:hypothetical protein